MSDSSIQLNNSIIVDDEFMLSGFYFVLFCEKPLLQADLCAEAECGSLTSEHEVPRTSVSVGSCDVGK